MTGCSAKGCRNSTAKGFLMKRFPRDPARRSAWAATVKREGWVPTNASCLCEVHFDDSQWEDQPNGGTPKLKRTAVPNVFCKCSYGKKRPRTSGSTKSNATVMTEHSYGSTQGNENSLAAMLAKGKVDRRYDHQYAILPDGESQAKGDIKKVKIEGRRDCHDDFCPSYNTPKRRGLLKAKMDGNNNGEQNVLVSTSGLESFPCEKEKEVEINQINGEVALIHVRDPLAIEESSQTSFSTSTNVQSPSENLIASLNAPLQVQQTSQVDLTPQVVQLVLLHEQPNIHRKIKEEPDIKLHYNIPEVEQPCAISRVEDPSTTDHCQSLPVSELCSIETKDHISQLIRPFENVENSSNNLKHTASTAKECNCKAESVEFVKVRAAEKVLARQGRLVKRVAALQRQLTRQKHSHEVEIEKLMKRFHDLEEKFDLTRSILRSCIGDDQFTVYATQNSRGVVWSKKTIEKAMQLRSSCGLNGYKAISKLLLPLPSDRTLQRYNQKAKQEGLFVDILKENSDE